MDMMEARRRILMLPQPIRVTWNQYAPEVSADGWQQYNSNYATYTFSNGIATGTWLKTGDYNGYMWSARSKTQYHHELGEKWYISYMVNPSQSGYRWSAEYLNVGRRNPVYFNADTWSRWSDSNTSTKGPRNDYMYVPYCYDSRSIPVGMTVMMKSPILINLTQMFGAGNEPDLETFEKQCAKNGIDLTAYQSENTSGTQRQWYL